MQTNHVKRIYKTVEQIPTQPTTQPKEKKGLLSPLNNKTLNNNEMVNEPLYRVAKYFNTIRNKRMEFKNGSKVS